jgi:hypothetical protein
MKRALTILMLTLAACSSSPAEEPLDATATEVLDSEGADVAEPEEVVPDVPDLPPPEPVVFTVITDTHVVGNQEHTVTKRLAESLFTMAGLDPAPQAIFITGDLIDSLETTPSLPDGFLPIFAEALAASTVPVHPVAGNHDYYAQNFPQFLLADEQSESDEMRRQALGIEPWYAVTLNGIKFILINSMQGELWDLSLGLSGSIGLAQLEWLDAELSAGAPAVLFLHHPPGLTEESEGGVTLEDVVAAHKERIFGIFAGHLHLWSRGEYGGVPTYLTAANQDGINYHHVRVDPTTMTMTILNEDEIDYGEMTVTQCDPTGRAPVETLDPFTDSTHHLLIADAVAEPGGFAEYLEEAIKMMPMLLRFQEPDPSGLALRALFTIGTYEGNAVGSLPPYVDTVEGAPCLQLDLLLDNPCFLSQPVTLTMDLAKGFGLPLPAGWNMRVRLTDVQLQGVATDAGGPGLEEGLLTMGLDLNLTVEDLQQIVVDQYCGNKIAACAPGTEGMPECPAEATFAFFDEIPTSCDVFIAGFGIRMVLGLIQTVPDGKGSISATFESWLPEASEMPKAGGYSPDLFSMKAGGNCAP